MRVISTPAGLRFNVALLFVCVPMAALEVAILTQAPWWNLPLHLMMVTAGIVTGICTLIAFWITSGKRWALRVTSLFAYLWSIGNAWMAIRAHNPSMGFFTAFLLLYFVALLLSFRREFERSYFDPQMKWFQGLPSSIPGVKCELAWVGSKAEYKVGRIDREGTFIFRDTGAGSKAVSLPVFSGRDKAELFFKFRDKHVSCLGTPMTMLKNESGAGFQFYGMEPDRQKELGDFIEVLRGEGYVE